MYDKTEMKGMSVDERIMHMAKEFFKEADSFEGNNRSESLQDLKFAAGEQWHATIIQSRGLEQRPTLTMNKLETFIRQVTNQQRQARPRIKVHPVNDQADKQVSDVLAGLVRHIEVNSNADDAYDIAYDYAVRMGWGYWRVIHDWVREDSFEQEIFIKPILNPFTVHFDPRAQALDGSDAEYCLISEMMPKDKFRDQYGDKLEQNWELGVGEESIDWQTEHEIRVAEFFYCDYKDDNLLLLADGSSVWEDEYLKSPQQLPVIGKRKSRRKTIKWAKISGAGVLEKRDWIGRYIPVVPVYGSFIMDGGKIRRYGIVRNAKDSQRAFNYWMSAITESIALAPKSKWLIVEGQDEGHVKEWETANISNQAVLRYKPTDVEGTPAPPPQRIQPEPPPDGMMTMAQMMGQEMQAIVGVYDATQESQGQQSGKALLGQQSQMDITNAHYFDNLCKSIQHTGKILLDLIPKIYSSERVMRIIGADGRPDLVKINRLDETTGKILNDVTVGEFDVIMDTGPAYNTRRLEFVNSMMPLLQDNEQLFQIAGDLFFRNLDFPSSETIADRLAANNPLSQIDQNSEIPPQVQMAIQKLQMENQQMQEQLQAYEMAFKHRQDIEQVKQQAETERKHMDLESKAYDRQSRHESEIEKAVIGAQTALDVAQMNNETKLREHGLSTAKLSHEVTRDHRALDIQEKESLREIHSNDNPRIK